MTAALGWPRFSNGRLQNAKDRLLRRAKLRQTQHRSPTQTLQRPAEATASFRWNQSPQLADASVRKEVTGEPLPFRTSKREEYELVRKSAGDEKSRPLKHLQPVTRYSPVQIAPNHAGQGSACTVQPPESLPHPDRTLSPVIFGLEEPAMSDGVS